MSDKKTVYFAYIPFGSKDEARALGRALIEKKLAACVNIIDGVESIYPWDGKIENSNEVVLIAKTEKKWMDDLTAFVCESHSYDVPCVQFLKTKDGNPDYVGWLHNNLK